MNNNKKYNGIWPVLVTPYNDDLSIDVDGYRKMLEWYMTFNIGGLYANCQSSEMFELTDDERLFLISEAVKVANGKIPVAATGNFGENVDQHIEFSKKVADAGVDVVMLTVPTFHNSDEELEKYYLAIAEKTEFELGIYECPVPRSYHLGFDLVKVIAETGRFFAYKETSCNIDNIKKFIEITEGTPFALLQANVPYMLESVKLGAPGSMNIAANWIPDLEIEVMKKGVQGNPDAYELNKVLCAMELAQRSIHPMGVKYLISKRGVPIKTLTRYPRTFSPEEQYSLDQASKLWFNEDGELRILKDSNFTIDSLK